jgi:hypothetical protein
VARPQAIEVGAPSSDVRWWLGHAATGGRWDPSEGVGVHSRRTLGMTYLCPNDTIS